MKPEKIAGVIFLLSVGVASAADFYFTRGPKTLEEGQSYSRDWENIINWSMTSPSTANELYNVSPWDRLPTSSDRVYFKDNARFNGPTDLASSGIVKISTPVYASYIFHGGAFSTPGITALTEDASINLTVDASNKSSSNSGIGNVVIDNNQWDENFVISANINISGGTSGIATIYNSSARSNGSTDEKDKKNMVFSEGYTITMLPNEEGKSNLLYIYNANARSLNGQACRTGDIIINSKIVTSNYVRLMGDGTAVDGYTPGVIRFSGSQSHEIGNINGFILASGIVVETGMTNGAQFCDKNVQITNGSTLRLLASDQLTDKCGLQFKTPRTSDPTLMGGTFEMNGFSERIGTLTFYGDQATQVNGTIDFGENSIEQVFRAEGMSVGGGQMIKEGSYLYILNYVLGEDHIYFDIKLSDSNKDMFVFEGYEDGYELSETFIDSLNTWEYSLVAIPEPSIFASVLGIIAISAVCLRRRR